MEEVACPVALRFCGEWAFASAILLADAQLEVACVPAAVLLLAAAARSHNTALATTASPADDWFEEMARPVAIRWGGVSASAPGCFYGGAGTLMPPVLCSITATPFAVFRSGWGAVFLALSLRNEVATGKG